MSLLHLQRWRSTARFLQLAVKYGTQGCCAVLLFHAYIGEASVSIGPSMLPTFNVAHDLVFFEKLSIRWRPLQLGDVVVCVSPRNPARPICKRVLGLPGDTVYVDPTVPGGAKPVTIPPGHIWLQGDNYNNSTDSRKYGPVPIGLLRGRVFGVWKEWFHWEWIKSGFVEDERSSQAVDLHIPID
ncbi:hypothetical protein HDU86_006664 [Geranomyces michiganensis]|nr:hypothetical protein HDU86_006664 [Geranomyces michiganensis]